MVPIRRWAFFRGELEGAEAPGFDRSGWRVVEVPHDPSLEAVPGTDSPFAPDSPGEDRTGWTLGGEFWYAADVPRDATDPDVPSARTEAIFDGAYMNADVWVDGVHRLSHPNGYTPFAVDLGGGDAPARVVVRLRNLGANSRWYSGSGLYRTVRRRSTGSAWLVWDGLAVTTPGEEPGSGTVRVRAEVAEAGPAARDAVLAVTVYDPDGQPVASAETTVRTTPGGVAAAELDLRVPQPRRWRPWNLAEDAAAPAAVYRAVAELRTEGVRQDRLATPFGFRRIEADARRGLRIDGQRVFLQGGCVHHDLGLLGAAAWAGAEDHRVRTLRAAGFNALRTAHNPPSRAFLEACDRWGMLVLDEVHDEWEIAKTPDSYHRDFPVHGLADARAMVRRDRNHPCVIAWSIGNEIPGCYQRPDLAESLRDAVRSEDATRPVTAGLCPPWWDRSGWTAWEEYAEVGFRHLDWVGTNYLPEKFRTDHVRYPDRVMAGLESFAWAAYDTWRAVQECSWVIGDFVWTAQDYIGESGIGQAFFDGVEPRDGAFPYHLSACGDLDLIGVRKPQSWYREALWRRGVVRAAVRTPHDPARAPIRDGWRWKWGWEDVASHWTWPVGPGTPMEVEVYTDAPRVQMWRNGRLVGELTRAEGSEPRLRIPVHYEPGVLEARAIWPDGHEAVHRMETAGEPTGLRLDVSAPPAAWRVDEDESVIVAMIRVVDGHGRPHPSADPELAVHLDGPVALAAFGNASPTEVGGVRDAVHRAWHGRALLVLRPTGPGTATVRVDGAGLFGVETTLHIPHA